MGFEVLAVWLGFGLCLLLSCEPPRRELPVARARRRVRRIPGRSAD